MHIGKKVKNLKKGVVKTGGRTLIKLTLMMRTMNIKMHK
jgi:hypothetical protein